jgi:hypothetical protein
VLISARGEGANASHELPDAIKQKDDAHGDPQERICSFTMIHC